MPAVLHVSQEVLKASIKQRLRYGDGAHCGVALEALPASSARLVGRIRVYRASEGDAPRSTLLNNIGDLELAGLIDTRPSIKTNLGRPPTVWVKPWPGKIALRGKDALNVHLVEQALWFGGIHRKALLDLGERIPHSSSLFNLSVCGRSCSSKPGLCNWKAQPLPSRGRHPKEIGSRGEKACLSWHIELVAKCQAVRG